MTNSMVRLLFSESESLGETLVKMLSIDASGTDAQLCNNSLHVLNSIYLKETK